MKKKSLLRNGAVQSLLASIACILLGLIIGYIVLLIINPAGAWSSIVAVIKNFLTRNSDALRMKNLGNTLVKTSPLIMCGLSVLFAYKAGMFNIGAAGQYVIGAGMAIYCAVGLCLPWYVCLLAAVVAAAILGGISGLLKSYCNVNEVISCIMLNWISLYLVNMLLTTIKDPTSPYTTKISTVNTNGLIPSLGLGSLFTKNKYVTIAIPAAIIIAVLIWLVLEKTRLGYELKATGYNRAAAKYCGMAEKRNLILTMVIAGALAGAGAAFFYLSDYEAWQTTQSSIPGMGFNGIAAAFLGGLNPIGTVFSSFFIQHITEGGQYVDTSMYCSQISDLISAIVIYLCGFVLFFKQMMNSILDKREEKKINAAKGGDR